MSTNPTPRTPLKAGYVKATKFGPLQRVRFAFYKLHLRLTGSTLTMYDSVDAVLLPAGGDAYAGYVNGYWPDFSAIKDRFPGAQVVSISTQGHSAALCFDCEPGNGVPSDCPQFYALAVQAGYSVPIIYCPASWTSLVRSAMKEAGIPDSAYLLWSAHYDLGRHICGSCGFPAADATQYADLGPYDASCLPADFFERLFPPPPTPAPQPAPNLESDDIMVDSIVSGPNLLVAAVDKTGALTYWVHNAKANSWTSEAVTTGLDPRMSPKLVEYNGNVQIFVQTAAGTVLWCQKPPDRPFAVSNLNA